MKCQHCGAELSELSKFCNICGKPVDADAPSPETDMKTRLAERSRADKKRRHQEKKHSHRYETLSFDEPTKTSITPEDSLGDDSLYEPSPASGANVVRPGLGDEPTVLLQPAEMKPVGAAALQDMPDSAPLLQQPAAPAPQNIYPESAYRESYPHTPVYEDDSRFKKSKKKHTALWISIIALLLVIAILTGVIFFIRGSAKAELEEAKQDYLPPVSAIANGELKQDDITFGYDDSARIISCSYKLKEKQYDQKYTYDDDAQKLTIETLFKKQTIANAEFPYSVLPSEPGISDIGYGYFGGTKPSSTASPGGNSDGGDKAGSAPVNETAAATDPVSGPAPVNGMPTAASGSASDWKNLYIEFLDSAGVSYSSGGLIHLDGDETPELVLSTVSASDGATVCYIKNGKVETFQTAATSAFSYATYAGYFITGNMHRGIDSGMIYFFDGNSCSELHSYSVVNDSYTIDGNSVTQQEYNNTVSSLNMTATPDYVTKDNLKEYISSYEG